MGSAGPGKGGSDSIRGPAATHQRPSRQGDGRIRRELRSSRSACGYHPVMIRPTRDELLLQVLLTALYLLSVVAVLPLTTMPNQIALIWPATGFCYAAFLIAGLRIWPFLPAGIVLVHALGDPVPPAYVPFSIGANLLGAVSAMQVLKRVGVARPPALDMRTAWLILAAGLLWAAVSATIGTLGLWITQPELPSPRLAAVQWFLGDVFGIVTVTPFALLAVRAVRRRRPGLPELVPMERGCWLAALIGSLWLLAQLPRAGGGYALATASLPFLVLLWSALRFEVVYTAFGAMLLGSLLVTLAGLGLAGFDRPEGGREITALLSYVCLWVLLPLVVAIAQHQHRVALARILRQATQDDLTGLPNRYALERSVAELPDDGAPRALAYLDLDQLKLVNDTLGHDQGDKLIAAVAGVLAAARAPGELLARLGGDEFALLLQGTPEQAQTRCRHFREAVAGWRGSLAGKPVGARVSVGLVPFRGRGDFHKLLGIADACCDAAKQAGGDRILCETDAGAEGTTRMRQALRLTEALESRRFRLYCQSILPLASGSTGRHYEVLLRLVESETGNVLLPQDFVPAAERYRLATRLDRYVVEDVLAWLEARPQAVAETRCVSINLSAASLADEAFADFVRTALRARRVPPDILCFEITETSALGDLERAQALIHELRGLGVRFALDDFGSGFAGFGYLKALEVDYLKIDGRFVQGMARDALDRIVVQSCTALACALGRQTVAEWVETPEQLRELRRLGVDHVQGFLIDRPQPIADYYAQPMPVLSLPVGVDTEAA